MEEGQKIVEIFQTRRTQPPPVSLPEAKFRGTVQTGLHEIGPFCPSPFPCTDREKTGPYQAISVTVEEVISGPSDLLRVGMPWPVVGSQQVLSQFSVGNRVEVYGAISGGFIGDVMMNFVLLANPNHYITRIE